MPRTIAGLSALLLAGPLFVTGGTAAGTTPGECGQPPAMEPLAFADPQVIDEVRAGGEPSVAGLLDGTLLYAAHASTTLFKRDNMPDPDYVTPYSGATYV
ncbi:MAG: hypothetical protein GEV04_15810 [Actinophytocola sp.]|nr:hypothetical protein [Actinophytocola sp.]